MNDALLAIILRVRQFRVAFSIDVVKMFRQFLIKRLDVDFQRFVYRRSKFEDIQDYRLVTVANHPSHGETNQDEQQIVLPEKRNV